MQTLHCILLHLLLVVPTAAAQSPKYAPAPQPGQGSGDPRIMSPAPDSSAPPSPAPSAAPDAHVPAPGALYADSPAIDARPGFPPNQAPSPSPYIQSPAPAPGTPNSLPPAYAVKDVKWCAVREEYEYCLKYTSLLTTPGLPWTCLLKENKRDCMEAIKQGDASLMSLEAGLAYVAFINYSMKAIMAEEYNFHAQSYAAVAVVNKQMCDKSPGLQLQDFRNLKSCHSGYLTAAGWNYPVQTLLNLAPKGPKVVEQPLPSDKNVISSFFSASCAPFELGDGGICSACGNGDNTSFCSSSNNEYTGEDGAFRCLMDGSGDIAFLRAKTPTLYSSDGLNSQSWSSKPVDEFMYLCPSGGCKPINDNYGSCQIATVPANVVMTRNSLPESLKQAIIKTLLAANWTDALYTGRNWQNYMLSVSTQGLGQVRQLTRHYLGSSALVSQTVLDLPSQHMALNVTSLGIMTSYVLGICLLDLVNLAFTSIISFPLQVGLCVFLLPVMVFGVFRANSLLLDCVAAGFPAYSLTFGLGMLMLGTLYNLL